MKLLVLTVFLLGGLGVSAEDVDIYNLHAAAEKSAPGAYAYGVALQELGRHAEAVRSFRKALDLDVLDAEYREFLKLWK